jgi:prohibitin 2
MSTAAVKRQIMMATSVLGGGLSMYYLLKNSIYSVKPGHMAIKFSKLSGMKSTTYHEGFHFRLPWFEKPIIYDVMAHP